MESKLTKHVVQCMQCDFQRTHQNYNSDIEAKFLTEARQHCKEAEHTVMMQT